MKRPNFFKRIFISIFKLEDYGMFLGERVSVAIKYGLLLLALLSFIISLSLTFYAYDEIRTGINYLKNDMSDFVVSPDGAEFGEEVKAYDEKYKFRLVTTNSEMSDDLVKQARNDSTDEDDIMILTKNEFFIRMADTEVKAEYKDALNEKVDKAYLISKVEEINIGMMCLAALGLYFLVLFFTLLFYYLLHLVLVIFFGSIASGFSGVRFKFNPLLALAIYSMTLSSVLNTIYAIEVPYFNFIIPHSDLMLVIIDFIYIIAAILMIKYDLIKQNEELQKIIEVQKQVHKEMEEKEQEENQEKPEEKENKENKENKEEKKQEKEEEPPVIEENREPDGSEI